MRDNLEFQADQIELVLQTHRSPGQVTGGVVTPRMIRYQIMPSLGARLASIVKLSDEIAMRLGAGNVRVSRQGPNIHIEVPRSDPKAVHLLPLCQRVPDMPKYSALLGIDPEGLPLVLRLPSPDVAHVLVSGTTGSGKTALAQSMVLSLAMYNRLSDVQMVLIDPKGTGFGPLADVPNLLRPVIYETHQAIFSLGELVEEMVRRDRDGINTPKIMVFIDEVADLMDQGGNAMARLLTRLTQRGRGAGIHIVACTQKPLAASIGSITRSNFPVRLVGSVTSPEDAKIAAGIAGTGAERLLGRGDFLLVMKGQVTRFQSAFATQTEMREVISHMAGGRRQSRQWFGEAQAHSMVATGTDGRLSRIKRSQDAIKTFFGSQLKLLK